MFTHQTLEKFILFLEKNNWEVYGPKKAENGIEIGLLEKPQELTLSGELPFYSFKRFFVPECETLFRYKDEDLSASRETEKKQALLGISILDLKAVLLYDQVFERDPSYQARRQNTLVIGHSLVPGSSQNIFDQKFEEDVLEHLNFDVFLVSVGRRPTTGNSEFAIFTGSPLGQKILEDFGYGDYIHIQFSGPVKEGKLDERMLKLKNNLENKHNQKIWDELGKRCIECGKCTIACPTCFCFRMDDSLSLENKRGERQRFWDACFYQEFSEIAGPPRVESSRVEAGGHKFLNSTAARIHFWYYHKFARIPEEFNFMGCVGCHRCAKVCPVGIDISEVLKNIEES